jgi:hypothetical protein
VIWFGRLASVDAMVEDTLTVTAVLVVLLAGQKPLNNVFVALLTW